LRKKRGNSIRLGGASSGAMIKKRKCKALIFRLSRKKKKWLSREEITTFRFERRLCLSKHAEQDSTENSEPKQVTQERESDLQNYFDDKPQQEETSENGNRGDDLWRDEFRKKRDKTDKQR